MALVPQFFKKLGNMVEAVLDEYSRLKEVFPKFRDRYLNKDKNFMSQITILGIMIFWIHCFCNLKVPLFKCLNFLNELNSEKYPLKIGQLLL